MAHASTSQLPPGARALQRAAGMTLPRVLPWDTLQRTQNGLGKVIYIPGRDRICIIENKDFMYLYISICVCAHK